MILTLHRHPGVPAGWAGPRHARPGWAGTVTTPVPAEPEPDHEGADEAYAAELHALAAELHADAAAARPLGGDSTALHDELRMTPTRLALLRAVRDEHVERQAVLPLDVLVTGGPRPRTVTARVQELRDHYLIRPGKPNPGTRAWVWELTCAGERVLAEDPETPPPTTVDPAGGVL